MRYGERYDGTVTAASRSWITAPRAFIFSPEANPSPSAQPEADIGRWRANLSVPGWGNPKVDDLWQPAKVVGQLLGVLPVTAFDSHPVFKLLATLGQS